MDAFQWTSRRRNESVNELEGPTLPNTLVIVFITIYTSESIQNHYTTQGKMESKYARTGYLVISKFKVSLSNKNTYN